MLTRWRRKIPRPIRVAALRLIGRAPRTTQRVGQGAAGAGTVAGTPPAAERVIDLAMPGHRPLVVRTPARTYVSKLLADGGLASYEPATLATFVAAIEHLRTPTAFDVGANIGVFAWVGAALTTAEIVAAEPTPSLAAQMRAIREENQLDFVVEELAFGATDGTAHLHLSDTTDSSNSLREGFRPSHESVAVPVSTIDSYVARTSRRPGVLKIDTESTEPDVLRGARDLLATVRPWLVVEVLAGRTETELTALLEPLGYRWYLIEDTVPWAARTEIVGDPSYVRLNWLFTPEEPPAAFWDLVTHWMEEFRGLPHRRR